MAGNRLGGRQGTAYLGTNAAQPPNWNFNDRDPNQYDTQNVVLGDLWMNTASKEVWVLVSLQGDVNSRGPLASWIMFSGGSGTVVSLTGDIGGVIDPDLNGNINVLGGNNLTSTGTLNTLTIDVTGTTNHAIQVGNATGSLTSLAVATNGQIPIGFTGANPVIATLTPGAGISIDNTVPGAITISNTGSPAGAFSSIAVQTFTVSGTYTPTANMKYCTIEVVGGGGGGGGCAITGAAEVSCGGGAGGGGYGRKTVSAATIGVSQVVTIGAGGAGGVGNASGVSGGTTSVGAIVSAAGGVLGGGGSASGANIAITASAGEGGTATSTDFIVMGGAGGAPLGIAGAGGSIIGGFGGGTYFAGSRVARSSNSAITSDNGNAGNSYGGGGGGGISMQGGAAANGGAGANGIVVITEFVSS